MTSTATLTRYTHASFGTRTGHAITAGAALPGEFAIKEAARLETATTMTTRGKYGRPGSTIPLNRPDWAVAVPIVDAVEASR